MLQTPHVKNLFDQAAFNRLQDEIAMAKEIKKEYPEVEWNYCLKAAKEFFSKQPLV